MTEPVSDRASTMTVLRGEKEPPTFDDRVTIGKYTYGLKRGSFVLYNPEERIDVGSFCSFAAETLIFGGGEHRVAVTSYPLYGMFAEPGAGHVEAGTKGPTVIGSDVWVGRRAMILSGVTVGNGAIIGAGAVVASDVAPYAVVIGNPARILRMRFDQSTVERLLDAEWWNWDDATIRARAHLFSDVAALLEVAEADAPTARHSRPSHPVLGPAVRTTRDLYLDLLRDALLGLLVDTPRSRKPSTTGDGEVHPLKSVEQRRAGQDWPVEGLTMIGEARLENVRACVERVIDDNVPGDIIEAGTWRGGATIFARGVLAAQAVRDRCVWVADSFAGLPPPREGCPADAGDGLHREDYLHVPEARVRANFARFGLLDEQVRFLPGWFADSLPGLGDQRFAVARLDGDMYDSTMVSLEELYPRVAVGGYLIVDDYGCLPACRQAVGDYRARHGITEEIVKIDWTGVYWRKQHAIEDHRELRRR